MNRRSRTLHRRSSLNRSTEPFLKYLKPGALAQIRDSRISSARSHRLNWLSQICTSPPSSPANDAGLPQVNVIDGFPCFSGRIYGPRCPQRKKLAASKSVLFLNPSSPVHDSPDPIIDVFSTDILAAH
ncbi:PREDICTED: AT4G26960 [Prunus dulcis]|uniref:PREDICTED: AT4G26960 n=1 Tax=Prunus dulcis TaxID=3755 RepID=A0A5E4EQ63_PRUDU|nr:uncharacterized protein LOC117621932 [Prunus dulcis]KAI5340325.1 hypothetical protein L3X38_019599 [Prunus dulcis]VVA17612.1 PREDICTED: AT4G26960 [Prunus dulcis]